MNQDTGKYIRLIGSIKVIGGIIVYFFHDFFRWFGRLPGDIRIEKKNFSFYFPLVTMIIISVIATLIFNVIRKIF
jgi:hypothetical protein